MEQSHRPRRFPGFTPFSKTARAVAPLPAVPEDAHPSRASSMTSETLGYLDRGQQNTRKAWSMTGNVGSFSLLGREAVERMTGAWAGKRIQSGLKEMQLRGVQLQAQEHKHEQNRCGCGTENHEQKHEQQDLSEIQNILTECRKLVSDTIALTDKRLDELLVQQKAVFDAVNMLRNTVQTGRERDKEKRLLRRQQVRELEEELTDSMYENEQLKAIIGKVKEKLQKCELPEKMVEGVYDIIGGLGEEGVIKEKAVVGEHSLSKETT